MINIAGCFIVKDNKILMVQETKESAYKKWSIPIGHVEKNETIPDAALRETLEETGCKVSLKNVLTRLEKETDEGKYSFTIFLADIIEENYNFDKSEILDVRWMDIEKVRQMPKENLRAYSLAQKILQDYENSKMYMIDDLDEDIER